MSRRTRQSRRKKRPAPESALAAFSDIAFLLLIFFIVTANLTKPEGVVSNIPAAEQGEETEDEVPTVQLDGRNILLNEKPVAGFGKLAEALNALELAKREDPADRIVQLEARDSVVYEDYFQAVVAITNAGGQLTIVQTGEGDGDGEGGGS